MHATLGRGAVTEPADGNGVFVLDAGCVRSAHCVGHVRADLARDAADAERLVGEVRRQLASAAVRVVGTGERAEEQLVRRDPEREPHAEVAVVEPRAVLPRSQRHGARDLRDLVPASRQHEAGAALAGQDPQPLVDRARDQRDVVDPSEQGGVGDVRILPDPSARPVRRSCSGWP